MMMIFSADCYQMKITSSELRSGDW